MADFTEYSDVKNLLRKTQESESDQRGQVREVNYFLHKKDGQWEPSILKSFSEAGRPRYTFDQCNDIVDDIAGELEQSDFGIKIRPAGGQASEDVAEIYDGLIRNIQAQSYADDVYDEAGRNMIATGFDAWRVNQRYGDADSFDQELFIDKIPNAVDSVWLDPTAYSRAPRKAKWGIVLEAMDKAVYMDRWPEGSGQSVTEGTRYNAYSHKPDVVVVGEIIYMEKEKRTIVEMTNGAIYEEDEDFDKIKDELEAQGITISTDAEGEERRRTREVARFKTRLFDGSDWLTDPQDTVFRILPIVPVYGNFQVLENKVVYWGEILHKLDAQRVYNYAESTKVSDGVLQPRPKLMVTKKQIAESVSDFNNINSAGKPVLTWTPDAEAPPPFMTPGPQIDPTLETISNNSLQNLNKGNLNPVNQPVGLRSGVAVEAEQNKMDTQNFKYMKSMEIAMCYTGEVLVDAIPAVYDTRRQIRVLGEDGKSNTVTINDRVLDEETREIVEVNNLAQGNYDVVCDVAPLFKNRQQETVAAFNELAQLDPTIIQEGKDIWLRNINAPGMDMMAERARARLLEAGAIPEDQLTDDEREEIAAAQAQAAQNPPPEDPLTIAARAEELNAQTAAQQQADDTQLAVANLQLEQQKLQLEALKLEGQREESQIKAIQQANKQSNDNLSSQISGLKDLIEAFGIEVMGGTKPAQLIAQQGANIDQTQKEELQ